MSRARWSALAVGVGLVVPGLLVLGACGSTTVVDEPTTTYPGETTTAPTGTPEELFTRLETSAFSLSTAIDQGEGAEALAQINGLWAAASAGMPQTEFVTQVQLQLSRMQVAVDRHRPADADKAARYLKLLIDARPT